jgi:hypothetical protein
MPGVHLFEIVGDITNVKVIATGGGIRRLKTLRKRHGGKRWRNSGERLPFGWRTDLSGERRSTGTRLMASASED